MNCPHAEDARQYDDTEELIETKTPDPELTGPHPPASEDPRLCDDEDAVPSEVEIPLTVEEDDITPKRGQQTLHAYLFPVTLSGECGPDETPVLNLFEADRSLTKTKTKRPFKPLDKPRVHLTYTQKKKIIEKVDLTRSISSASETYGIARSTIQGYLNKRAEIILAAKTEGADRTKKAPLLIYHQLAPTLMAHVLQERARGSPMTRVLAAEWCSRVNEQFASLAQETKLKTVSRFMSRDNMVLRKPTNVAQQPAPMGEVKGLYKRLTGALRENKDMSGHPVSVVILDETSVNWRPVAPKVIDIRGARTITVLTKGSEKQTCTALLAGIVDLYWDAPDKWSAVNQRHIKPLVLFKGKPDKSLQRRMQPFGNRYDVEVEVTPNGWITSSVFETWCTRHLSNLPQPAWVFMDMHSTHRTNIDFMENLGLKVWLIPHGCTSKIQVHDTHINAPFKASLRRSFGSHLSANSRPDDERGEVKYTDILRWVRVAMSSVPATLLSEGLERNILCAEVLREVGSEKDDSDKAYAEYKASYAADQAAKVKAKQDAIDLKVLKAANRASTAEVKRNAAQKTLEIRLEIIRNRKELAEALVEQRRLSQLEIKPKKGRKSSSQKNKSSKERVPGKKRPREASNNAYPMHIVIRNGVISAERVFMPPTHIYGKPRPPWMDEEGHTDDESDGEAPAETDQMERRDFDEESYDSDLIDCHPDWIDEAEEELYRANCDTEEDYVNGLMARINSLTTTLNDSEKRRFRPRSANVLVESCHDEEESEESGIEESSREEEEESVCNLSGADEDEGDNDQHNKNGDFVWDAETE